MAVLLVCIAPFVPASVRLIISVINKSFQLSGLAARVIQQRPMSSHNPNLSVGSLGYEGHVTPLPET
jgi:hypothetical protein